MGLNLILEQPKPKPNATRLRPDFSNSSSIINTGSDEVENTSGSSDITSNNMGHRVSQKCKRLHRTGEAELIPEPFKSELESAVNDAESNDASSYVADHLCYMDEEEPYLALAGRTQSGDDFYFPLTQEGSDWRWIDHEDRSGSPKAKPFEQY